MEATSTALSITETVPEPSTDPLWYWFAHRLAPHTETTRKVGWIEGFVSALDYARGGPDDDGVGEVLRATLGKNVEVPVAVRSPQPPADVESLAYFMFERQAVTYEADLETLESAWDDPGVKQFWMSEAKAVLRFLP